MTTTHDQGAGGEPSARSHLLGELGRITGDAAANIGTVIELVAGADATVADLEQIGSVADLVAELAAKAFALGERAGIAAVGRQRTLVGGFLTIAGEVAAVDGPDADSVELVHRLRLARGVDPEVHTAELVRIAVGDVVRSIRETGKPALPSAEALARGKRYADKRLPLLAAYWHAYRAAARAHETTGWIGSTLPAAELLGEATTGRIG